MSKATRARSKKSRAKPKKPMQHLAALHRVEMYCQTHPRGPSAVRQPRWFKRGKTWVALLGANVRDGIAGFGSSVEAALHHFDIQYLQYLDRPSDPTTAGRRKASIHAVPR